MTRYCVECEKMKPPVLTRSTFGEIGKSPMYCKEHMKEGMIDMKNDRCNCGECKPSYNVKGESAMYCIKCKEDGMVNVISKMCILCQDRKPSFNVPGKAPDYCGKCVKTNNMKGMENVNNKKCKYTENDIQCKRNPKFNLPGQRGGEFCDEHKPNGYVNVINKK